MAKGDARGEQGNAYIAAASSLLVEIPSLPQAPACRNPLPRASSVFPLLLDWQAIDAVIQRVFLLSNWFDIAVDPKCARLAAALAGSSLPVAALAAADHLQRAGHPQAHERVRAAWAN